MEKYGSWREDMECLPEVPCSLKSTPPLSRPSTSFNDLSRRSQLRATEDLRARGTPELVFAASSTLQKDGHRRHARLVEAAGSPNRGRKMSARSSADNLPVSYTPPEALSFLIDNDLTKTQYTSIRLDALQRHAPIYPSYDCVRLEKSLCMSPLESISVTEKSATVRMQALLNHTAQRLLHHQAEVLQHLLDRGQQPPLKLTLMCKWGMDGCTGQSQFKQVVDSDNELFMTFLCASSLGYEQWFHHLEQPNAELAPFLSPHLAAVPP